MSTPWDEVLESTAWGGEDDGMMRVVCTACRAELDVDEAFAGGVCRCSQCGAIQTVPKASAGGQAVGGGGAAGGETGTAGSGGGSGGGGKTLFRKKGQAVVGSGLEDLAQAVASSGLGSSRLRKGPRSAGSLGSVLDVDAGGRPSRARLLTLGLVGGAIVAVAVGVGAWMLSGGKSVAPEAGAPGGIDGGPAAAVAGSGVPGLDLSAHQSVVYLLDRGSASQEVLGAVKAMAVASAEALGDRRKYAILFWSNGTPDAGYPVGGLAYAVSESTRTARRVLDDVVAFGQSDATPAFARAMELNPDAVVVVTSKGFDLDDAWADALLQSRGDRKTVVHAISIGNTPASAGLKRLADRTGGKYLELSPAEVRGL